MRNILKAAVLAVAALALTGCGLSTVPPGTKGKILSSAGYSADVKESGRYWLFGTEEMVLLDTSTQTQTEKMTVKMADKLDLAFSVRFRTRIGGNDKVINAMFNDIRHENYAISLPKVYSVYGRDVVQNVARSVVSKYRTEEVPQNYDKINADLQEKLRAAMANSPLEVSNVTLADVTYPLVITAALEKQQERELAIQTEANEQAVKMVQKENELRLAQADYEVRMTKAKAVRDENQITAAGLNPMLLEYRRLEVLENLGAKGNSTMIPVEGLVNPIMQSKLLGR
jgi:hypothetical protein